MTLVEFATTPAPHNVTNNSVGRVMRLVVYALVPMIAASVYYFGWGLVVHLTIAIAASLAFEALALKLRGRPIARS